MVELRLDLMEERDLRRLLEARGRPVIVTNRPVREGGRAAEPEAERLEALVVAARLGAEYVDVELDSVARLGKLPARRPGSSATTISTAPRRTWRRC